MSALDNILDDSYIPFELSEWDDARAELAALRATHKAYVAMVALNAEQARQLEASRKHISRMTDYCQYWLLAGKVMIGSNDGLILRDDIITCRAWLAANAPAPQAEQAK